MEPLEEAAPAVPRDPAPPPAPEPPLPLMRQILRAIYNNDDVTSSKELILSNLDSDEFNIDELKSIHPPRYRDNPGTAFLLCLGFVLSLPILLRARLTGHPIEFPNQFGQDREKNRFRIARHFHALLLDPRSEAATLAPIKRFAIDFICDDMVARKSNTDTEWSGPDLLSWLEWLLNHDEPEQFESVCNMQYRTGNLFYHLLLAPPAYRRVLEECRKTLHRIRKTSLFLSLVALLLIIPASIGLSMHPEDGFGGVPIALIITMGIAVIAGDMFISFRYCRDAVFLERDLARLEQRANQLLPLPQAQPFNAAQVEFEVREPSVGQRSDASVPLLQPPEAGASASAANAFS